MLTPRRRDAACLAGLFAASATLYLSFQSKVYVFEGLARALPIELGHWRTAVHGNYLAYGLVGGAFHRLLQACGLSPLAVVSLQTLDAFLGAAGLCVFYVIQRVLGAGRPAAAAWAAVLGLTQGYWMWSSEAENYVFSALLLQLLFLALAARLAGRRVPAALIGALHALAVTGHLVNIVFVLPAAFVVARTGSRRELASYAGAWLGGMAALYGAALAFVRPPNPVVWFLGSAASGQGVNLRDTWSVANLGVWLGTTGKALVADPWRPAALVAAVVTTVKLRGLRGVRRDAALAAGLWLLGYAVVFTRWEPYTMVYRVTDLAPLVLLLSLAWPATAGAVLAGLLAVANGPGAAFRADAANNPRLARMEFIRGATQEGDWVAGEGGDELYIPYFAQRRPLLLGRRREDLEAGVASLLAAGQRVYLPSAVVDDSYWGPRLRSWKLEKTASDAQGGDLYRVKQTPSASK